MANEGQVRISLQVRNSDGTNFFQSQPTSNVVDVSRLKTSPGDIDVPTTGVVITLTQLNQPGLCWLQNLDSTNFITIGIYDNSRFYPLIELKPLEFWLFRLTRYLNQEFVGTSTGTNADANKLMAIADTDTCILRLNIFDS